MLIRSLAARLSEVGRLKNLGVLNYSPEHRPVAAANSAYRVAALNAAWKAPAVVDGEIVLVVDDMTDTGWTLTMATQVLRASGAVDVLPFALASVS